MFQVSLTLPTAQHDGTSNRTPIEHIKRVLSTRYGGYSSTLESGGWIDDKTGELYEDTALLMWTFVETEYEVEAIKQQAARWAHALQQIQLFVTVTNSAQVFLIDGTRTQARQAQPVAA